MSTWLPAICLVLAAVPVAWPRPGHRRRQLRRVLAGGWDARSRDPGTSGPVLARGGWSPRVVRVLLVIALVVIAAVPGGLVGAAVAAAYGVAALRAAHHRAGRERSAESRRELLDRLGAAAADLRAGVPAATALLPPATGDPGPEQDPEQGRDPLRSWVGVVVALAERTGAPLAELLERLEADGRATDRARSGAAAQAAGSQATAWLLSGLPVGGIALGYAIGADPLAVLFRTPVGAGCALGAVALQLAGLAWSRRITRQEVAG